jgi:hypothetical protein
MRMMLLGGAALAWPLVVRARQAVRLLTVGYLGPKRRLARSLTPFNIQRRTHQILLEQIE